MEFNLEKYKKVHIIGIKGSGVAALAEMLKNNGYEVSGSDSEEDFVTTSASLKNAGIFALKFGEKDLMDVDAVIHSQAYNKENNQEVRKAVEFDIPVFTYPQVVAYFFNNAFGVAIAGTHGKTTTTAMLAFILAKSGRNTNAIVGSRVVDWGSGAKTNDLSKKDALFILEADEYKDAFLNYFPKAAIVTNVDYDHPDFFEDKERYDESFEKFVISIPTDGFLITNKSDASAFNISQKAKCKVLFYDENLINFNLKIPGHFNQLNANAAYLAACELGVASEEAKKYLEEFSGVARRFEFWCQKNNTVIIDDFAHHPSEIKATLLGAKEKFPDKKIAVIFQPHTYSRTKALFDDFALSLGVADFVVLAKTESSARETFDASVDLNEMAEKIGQKAVYIENRENILKNINRYLDQDFVIITMGAGDIWKVASKLCERST